MIDIISGKCYIVETAKIAHNIRVIRKYIQNRRIYAVLKADGYGLGCRKMAAVCAENGLRCFAVGDLAGAEEVVASGVEIDELLLLSSAHPCEIPRLAELGVTFTVASQADAKNLEPYRVRAHVKIDTGMGRRGFLPEEVQTVTKLYSNTNLQYTGIYTHFSDGMNEKKTQNQFVKFKSVSQFLRLAGIDPGVRHCCSSTSAFRYEDMLLDGVRVGTALLGRLADGERFDLQRTGICQIPIESVKRLPKGSFVGYGSVYYARREVTVALCPVGTHNGFGVVGQNGLQRLHKDGREVLSRFYNRINGNGLPYGIIHNRKCNVLGRLCSEVVMLDVTGVPCRTGDMAQFEINPMLLHDVPVVFV